MLPAGRFCGQSRRRARRAAGGAGRERARGESEARTSTGILLALGAHGLFTLMDTTVKILGGRYSVVQVLFFNAPFSFTTMASIAALRGRRSRLASPQWRLHLLRWLIGLPGALAIFWAYPRMPLADVYALLFAAPLFMTALSLPALGERVGWHRWSALIAGFAGIVVMLRPGSTALGITALAALLGGGGCGTPPTCSSCAACAASIRPRPSARGATA